MNDEWFTGILENAYFFLGVDSRFLLLLFFFCARPPKLPASMTFNRYGLYKIVYSI